MGSHDEYGKEVVRRSAQDAAVFAGPSVQVSLGAGNPARIDAVVAETIAVEIESRTAKQVRGAVLDLICHAAPKKLLLLLPAHMSNPSVVADQCDHLLRRFLDGSSFQVCLLEGTGDRPSAERDAGLVRQALATLGYAAPEGGSVQAAARSSVRGAGRSAAGKYANLERHLRRSPEAVVSMTFREVEQVLAFSLPKSATVYREWWANQIDVSQRPQARAWSAAGFAVSSVDLQSQLVSFERDDSAATEAQGGVERELAPDGPLRGPQVK